jgi:hypothetical protein
MHRRLFIAYGLALLPLAILMLGNGLYLKHAEEYMPVRDLVTLQRTGTGFCIYGTAIHQNDLYYKLEGHRQALPTVAAIGSSRVMQMRERYFTEPFFNLGGTMTSIDEGWHTVHALLNERPPQVLLMGIDLWWFNDRVRPAVRTPTPPAPKRLRMDMRAIFLPTQWLLQGKISMKQYFQKVLHTPQQSAPCAMGVQGQLSRTGFGPDGSFYYTTFITGKNRPTSTVNLIRSRTINGNERFQYGDSINSIHWEQFQETIDMLKRANVKVVLFIPPMHPEIVTELKAYTSHYGYIDDLRRHIATLDIPFFDFHDPAFIGSSGCEFIDAYHGGDVLAARMLRYIYDHTEDPEIRSMLAIDVINQTTTQNAGLAMAKDSRITAEPETDFLKEGCKKR